jgi:hypothetical protein
MEKTSRKKSKRQIFLIILSWLAEEWLGAGIFNDSFWRSLKSSILDISQTHYWSASPLPQVNYYGINWVIGFSRGADIALFLIIEFLIMIPLFYVIWKLYELMQRLGLKIPVIHISQVKMRLIPISTAFILLMIITLSVGNMKNSAIKEPIQKSPIPVVIIVNENGTRTFLVNSSLTIGFTFSAHPFISGSIILVDGFVFLMCVLFGLWFVKQLFNK